MYNEQVKMLIIILAWTAFKAMKIDLQVSILSHVPEMSNGCHGQETIQGELINHAIYLVTHAHEWRSYEITVYNADFSPQAQSSRCLFSAILSITFI